ncbi:MAG: hypothetical protein WAN39_03210 [Candidatus Cybelea sp.]
MKAPAFHGLTIVLAVAFLAGCSFPQVSGPAVPAAAPARNLGPANGARTGSSGQHVYSGACCQLLKEGGVVVYQPGLAGVARRFTRGAHYPFFLTFDRSGRLYVVSLYGRVSEFDAGQKLPSRIITGVTAVGVATDASNNAYVDSCLSCVPTRNRPRRKKYDWIELYKAGTTKPLMHITQGVSTPRAIALDSKGNLYVANQTEHASVTIYAPGSNKVMRTITRGVHYPIALAFDAADDLYVVNLAGGDVVEYAPGSGQPMRVLNRGVVSPEAIAVDSSGTLYVANAGPASSRGWISVIPPGATKPAYKITDGLSDPVAVAVDSGGNLYVASNDYGRSGGEISEYAPNSKHPLQTVARGGYGDPVSLALGP